LAILAHADVWQAIGGTLVSLLAILALDGMWQAAGGTLDVF
jgi:hypothetical protein